MSKLSVGIVLEKTYDPTTGGGYTYYDMLVSHIDKYTFNDRLNIVYIYIGNEKIDNFNKQIIYINPLKYFGRYYKLIEGLLNFFVRPFFNSSLLIRRFYNSFLSYNNKFYKKYIEQELTENKVDLLYYLIPGKGNINYPFILTHWDNGHLSMFSFPEVAMNNNFKDREHHYRTILGKAFAVFCESIAGKEELVKYSNINPNRIFIVPIFPGNVVQITLNQNIQKTILEKYNLSARKFFFYPAQFWSHKNHYNLLLAFKNLLKDQLSVKLVFSGSDKGNLEYIKQVIGELNLDTEVIITGFVDTETLYTFYKNAIALVMPTFLGPTNIPLLEAQAIGCHVICSELEGHREMLGDNAFYIDPENPDTISEAMLWCLTKDIMAKPMENAVFNIENAVSQMEVNFLKIISKRKTFGYNFLFKK